MTPWKEALGQMWLASHEYKTILQCCIFISFVQTGGSFLGIGDHQNAGKENDQTLKSFFNYLEQRSWYYIFHTAYQFSQWESLM